MEVKAVAVEKVVGTGLLQRVILLEADAETLPQKENKVGRAVVREAL